MTDVDGATADVDDSSAATTPVAMEPSSTSSGPMFSQEDVNKILAREKRKWKQTTPTASKASSQEPPDLHDQLSSVLSPVLDQLSELRSKIDAQREESDAIKFDKVFRESGIPDKFRDLCEADIKVRNPTDKAKRLQELKDIFDVEASQPAAGKPVRPDTPMPGNGPVTQKDFSGYVDISTLTGEDVSRLKQNGTFFDVLQRYRQGGPDGARPFAKKPRR